MIAISIIAGPSCTRTMSNETNEMIGQSNEWLYFSRTELRTSTWKCPWKVPLILQVKRSWKKKLSVADYSHLSNYHRDTSWVVHKSKMLQAVRISCPRKFIINNHIFSSYRSLYKAPFIFLSSFRFCVYGSASHILFIESLRFFDSTLSIFLSLTFASRKNEQR